MFVANEKYFSKDEIKKKKNGKRFIQKRIEVHP